MKVKDIVQKPPKILLYGSPGSGKTALTATFGGDGFFVDLDDGLLTALRLQDQHTSLRHELEFETFIDVDATKFTSFSRAKACIIKLANQVNSGRFPHKAIIVDSFTSLADKAVQSVLSASGKDPFGKREIQHWGIAMLELESCLTILRALPIVVVFIAHDMIVEVDEQSQIQIAVFGKSFPGKIAGMFDELWYMRAKNLPGGKTGYVLQSTRTAGVLARSRNQLPDKVEVTTLTMKDVLKKIDFDLEAFPTPLEAKEGKK